MACVLSLLFTVEAVPTVLPKLKSGCLCSERGTPLPALPPSCPWCSVEVQKLLPEQARAATGPPIYYLFNFFLILLLVLHVYWWILIAKVIYRQIAGSGIDDVRSGEGKVGTAGH